jgi:4-hydroxy-tetrahydrodipicolinate synthase
LTPFFLSVSQRELYGHFKAIAEATPLPVILYDNKPKTQVTIHPETVARLADIPNIIGMKDSTGDFTNMEECLRLTSGKDFAMMQGRDTLIHAALCYGAKGAVAACANVAPGICADIYNKFASGDLAGSLEAQYRLAPLRIAFAIGSFPAVIKESLALLGMDVGACLPPTGGLTSEERERLRIILSGMGLLPK